MSQSLSVVVLCPRGRRQTVKISPNSSILQILEEACNKQNINPDDFDLCHYSKPLDLSLPFRFSNVPNNALLELHPTKNSRTEAFVTVGLQLESGDRIMKEFPPSSTVWEVIQACLSERSDVIPEENTAEPVCIYMRQKLTGDAIKTTTLRKLGLTKGTAIIRLMYRESSAMEDQAHVSTPLSKPSNLLQNDDLKNQNSNTSVDSTVSSQKVLTEELKPLSFNGEDFCDESKNKPCSDENNVNDEIDFRERIKNYPVIQNFVEPSEIKSTVNLETRYSTKDLEKCKNMENNCDEESMELDHNSEDNFIDINDIKYIGERHSVLYSLDDVTSKKNADLPDEFFDLTIKDVKYLMEEYKNTRTEMENQPLLTNQQRERQILQKLSRYRDTVIRVYFPERLVLQAVFKATETVQDVMNFIKSFLEDKELHFYLYVTPPKEKLCPSKTLLEAMLIPAAVIYFSCDMYSSQNLHTDLRKSISDPRAAILAASESRKLSFSSEPLLELEKDVEKSEVNEMNTNVVPSTSGVQCTKPSSAGKLPKWLKLSKQ